MRPSGWIVLGAGIGLGTVCVPARPAFAQEQDQADLNEAEAGGTDVPASGYRAPSIGRPSSWALGIDGYAGLLAQFTGGEDHSHGFVGGLARLRFHYFQAGVFVNTTDPGQSDALLEPVQETFRTVGGFAGAWLPYSRWIDLEAAIGYGSRLYQNPNSIYGKDGMKENTSVLSLRVGISDRSTERLLGGRVSAAFFTDFDLNARDVTWRRTYLISKDAQGETTGTTPIGGVSVGLLVSVGLELGGGVARQD